MADMQHAGGTTRRAFLKDLAVCGGAVALTGSAAQSSTARASQRAAAGDPKAHVGIQLYTIRDVLGTDYEGSLAKLAALGYTEVEGVSGYNNMEPKAYRAMLDRHGLSMPSTHAGASGGGVELERQLEGFQIIGMRYCPAFTSAHAAPVSQPTEAPNPPVGGSAVAGEAAPPAAPRPPASVESVRQRAAKLNADGRIAQKFGMKILVHNHTEEFDLLDDGRTTTYDVLVRETDPGLVAMELDIGWASVAAQDILALFNRTPGRFELWHVKDATGMKGVNPRLPPAERRPLASLVPVGLGEVDYKPIFASAQLAGMTHFYIEQDNAAAWGDSIAAAKVSYQNLVTKVLS
jgi:sugar phosphate isomerase/epimerase